MLHLQENVVGHIVLDKLISYRSVHAPDSNVVFFSLMFIVNVF